MADLFGYRWRAPETRVTGAPDAGSDLDALRAWGETMLDASSRAIASVADAQTFLTQNRQRNGQ